MRAYLVETTTNTDGEIRTLVADSLSLFDSLVNHGLDAHELLEKGETEMLGRDGIQYRVTLLPPNVYVLHRAGTV